MPGNIFLSYRRDDAPAEARAIQLALERAFGKSRVFMDIGGIEPGEDFADKLVKTLRRCKVMVVVIGPRWLAILKSREQAHFQSTAFDFVRMEIADALREGKAVIPVLVGDARMPDQMELYGELMQLGRHQAIEIRSSHFPVDAEQLVKSLKRIIGHSHMAHWKSLVAAVAAMTVVGGTGLVLQQNGKLAWLGAGKGQQAGPARAVKPQPVDPEVAAGSDVGACRYEPFRGASLPGGAATVIALPSNTTQPCRLSNVNARRVVPANLALRRPARWGNATVLPDGVISYLPPKDFIGLDHFVYHSTTEPYSVAVMANVYAPGQALPKTTFVEFNAVCKIAPFRGAAMPGGSGTVITVRNTGKACRIANYPRPGQPPLELEIVRPPRNGEAKVLAGGIMTYMPRPGFRGRDNFAYKSPTQPFAVSVNVVVLPAN